MCDNWGNNFADNKYRIPDPASELSGLLSHLNIEELREVLNDDKKSDELIKDYKGLKDKEVDKEMLMASNRSLAEFNLSQEPLLAKEKLLVKGLSETGEVLFKKVEEKMKEMNEKSGNVNLETALALLQSAACEMEDESEAIAEKFLEGDIDLDSFLERFTTTRKLMHLRKFKTDKMTEMVSRRQSGHHHRYEHQNIHHHDGFSASHQFYQPPPVVAPVNACPIQPPYPSGSVSDVYLHIQPRLM